MAGQTRTKTATIVASVAVLAAAGLGLAAPAAADPIHHHRLIHHAWRHHGHRVVVIDRAYVPTSVYRQGLDDDSAADDVAVGREDPVPGPNNVGPGLALESTSPDGYEIEGPPISPSLPNLPVLTPELIR